MAVTRAKATALLNKTEMGLYDDSRANALRGHSEAKLSQLVTRARTARDRARDLEKRQRLASRGKTGSKSGRSGQANARTGEKAELLADILVRLETQQRDAMKAAKAAAKQVKAKPADKKIVKKAAATRASAGKIAPTKTASQQRPTQVATKKTAAKKSTSATGSAPAAKKAAKSAPRKTPGRVAKEAAVETAGKTRAKKAATKSPAASDTGTRKKRSKSISPEQALDNTRKLLEQHDVEAKSPKSWETLGGEGTAPVTPGYQSPQARANALALHAAESRQASIQGSSSTRDRRNQGKRDHRNDE